MPCCKAKEYGWCKEEPVAYTDPETGEEYCLFHAPAEHKQIGNEAINVEIFNQHVFKKIEEVQERGICYFNGTIFPGNIDFSASKYRTNFPKVVFSDADFCGEVYFDNMSTNESMVFDGAKFRGEASFAAAIFSVMNFSRSQFSRDVTFNNSSFRGEAIFTSTRFQDSYFYKAQFQHSAQFDQAHFGSSVSFYETRFASDVSFLNTRFSGQANFGKIDIEGKGRFDRARFEESVDFESAMFKSGVSFDQAEFRDQLRFCNAMFLGLTYFYSTKFFAIASFLRCNSETNAIRIEDLTGTSLINMYFSGDEVQCLSFKNCQWPTRFAFEINVNPGHSYQACMETYRALKQKAANEHDQPMVSRWHYRERLMAIKAALGDVGKVKLLDGVDEEGVSAWARAGRWVRLCFTPPWRPKLSIAWWYWSLAGFGERYRRAGVWLVVFVLLALPTFALAKVVDTGWGPVLDPSAALDVLREWPTCLPLYRAGTPPAYPLLSWIWQLLIALQAALFGFALRNSFRR